MSLPLTSINGDVKWNGAQIVHASGWTINPTNNAQTYTTNKTKGKVGRRPGNIDCQGTFNIKTPDGNVPAVPGKINRLELFCDATHKWDIQDAIILGYTLDVNLETGAIEGIAANWAFAGKDDATNGTITAPDGTTLDSTGVGP